MKYSVTRYIVWILVLIFTFSERDLSGQQHENDQISLIYPEEEGGKLRYNLNPTSIKLVLKQKPAFFTTQLLSREGVLISISVKKTVISRKKLSKSLFYQGKITNGSKSLVSLTITENGISGFISDHLGNYKFTTDKDSIIRLHLEDNNKSNDHWTCQTTTAHIDKNNYNYNKPNYKSFSNDTLSIYFVCDYELFELHGFSTEATLAYVYDLFHQVKTIYDSENINIIIEDVFIWESPDPFDDTSAEAALLSFRDELGQNHSGHFAHLLSGTSALSGGIAFINGLCDRNKSFGYSNVDAFIDTQGGYSWDVHVVAHELGHNMGSPHTHDCAWGQDGTEAIDACGGPLPACEDAPIPSEGGTIMSYCHTAPVGVNFSLGFGQEPGDLIREMIQFCNPVEGESCEQAIIIDSSGTYYSGLINSGSGASHPQATHARWYKFIPPANGTIEMASCGQNVDTRLFLYTGVCHELSEFATSDDDCLSGSGYNYASQIINLNVSEGSTIFIEWDDRWSNDSFEFSFSFTNIIEPSCTNGIMDGQETDIDCGGNCVPCLIQCDDDVPLPSMINDSITFITQSMISYNGIIDTSAFLELRTNQGLEINPGFEIFAGGQLEADIGNCNN